MAEGPLRAAWRYGIAVGAVLLATLARLALDPALGPRQPFSTYFAAVVVVAWAGELGPALLALALGLICGAFFCAPIRSPHLAVAADWIAPGNYLVLGSVIIAFSEGHRLARLRLEREAAERRRAEGLLRESDGRFRQLAATIGDVFWMGDPFLKRVLYVSPAYEAIWGRPCEALYADFKQWLDAIHPEDRPRVEAAFFDGALAGAYDEQYRVVRPDGTIRWVRDRGYPVRGDSGEVVRVVGIAEDITERRQSEGRARRLKALSDHANDALLVVGPDGGILDANEVACEWLGHSRVRLLTLGVADIAADGRVGRLLDLFRDAPGGRLSPFEGLLRRWDGSALPVEIGAVVERFEGDPFLLAVMRDVTGRREAEEALRASEGRLRQLADTMPQVVWTAGPDGEVEWSNGRWFEYTGADPGEPISHRRWREAIHPDDLGRFSELRERAVGEGGLIEAEVRLQRRDGSYRWHLVRSVPVRDEEGRVIRRFGTATDIDDRKRAEELLRSNKERLELALEAGHMGTWEWDMRTGSVAWSENLEEVHGLPPGGFDGTIEGFRRLIHPEDQPRVEAEIARSIEAGSGYEVEFRVPRPDGSVGWMLGKGKAFADEDGRTAGMLGLGMDITERHRREEELRASESRFRQLAEAMPQIVWVADSSGRNQYMNQHWEDFTGRPTVEGLSDRWTDSVHPDDLAGQKDRWETCLRGGSPFTAEYRLRGRDGTYRWHIVRAVPVTDDGGRVARWYGSSTDIDEPKRMAEALRDADRRKDEFLAMLAHELRNPLAPIRNAVSIMAMAEDDREAHRWSREVIDRQVRHLTRLVDDLLDVTRITQGKITFAKAPLDVSSFVHAAVESSRPLIDARTHRLDVAIAEEPLRVEGVVRAVQ